MFTSGSGVMALACWAVVLGPARYTGVFAPARWAGILTPVRWADAVVPTRFGALRLRVSSPVPTMASPPWMALLAWLRFLWGLRWAWITRARWGGWRWTAAFCFFVTANKLCHKPHFLPHCSHEAVRVIWPGVLATLSCGSAILTHITPIRAMITNAVGWAGRSNIPAIARIALFLMMRAFASGLLGFPRPFRGTPWSATAVPTYPIVLGFTDMNLIRINVLIGTRSQRLISPISHHWFLSVKRTLDWKNKHKRDLVQRELLLTRRSCKKGAVLRMYILLQRGS